MNLFYQPLIDEGINHLDADESRHCIKVLRKQIGETILITDGKGFFYNAVIEKADPSKSLFKVVSKTPGPEKQFSIHLAIAPTKNADRIEWCLEKCVEIGIDRITLLECKNSERTFIKTERLRKVAISAMKQSLKASLPVINDLKNFRDIVKEEAAQKFIAFVDSTNPLHLMDAARVKQDYLIFIGPEGDFTMDEMDEAQRHGFVKVSLGDSRLRTETAGVTACHILNLVNR